jgi:protein-S-isoprenylcysteine O-methyltransferase Ste14
MYLGPSIVERSVPFAAHWMTLWQSCNWSGRRSKCWRRKEARMQSMMWSGPNQRTRIIRHPILFLTIML